MERIRNGPRSAFTFSDHGVGAISSVAGIIRQWAYPAAVLGLWLAAALFTVSQLVTVRPALEAIPDARHLAQPLREKAGPSARRGDPGAMLSSHGPLNPGAPCPGTSSR